MVTEYAQIRLYIALAIEAALPGYEIDPDQPKQKADARYVHAMFAGVTFENQNGVYDTGTFEFDVFAFHPVPETGTIDEKVAEAGSALRYALLAEVSPRDIAYMPMVTEHVREAELELELDGAFVTRTRFSCMSDVARRPPAVP